MPNRPASRICNKCRKRYITRTCPNCSTPDNRPSPSARGYDNEWKKIREEVLRIHGIPEDQWSLYDIDHNPPYNKDIEPDHRRYTLTPLLHADHSYKTAVEDTPRVNGQFAPKEDGSKMIFDKELNTITVEIPQDVVIETSEVKNDTQ